MLGDSTGGQSRRDQNAADFETRHGRARGPNNTNEGKGEGECEGEGCFREGEEEAEGTSEDSVDSMSEDSVTSDGEGNVLPGLLGDEEGEVEVASEDSVQSADEASVASEESVCDPEVSTCEEGTVVPGEGRRLESLLNQN